MTSFVGKRFGKTVTPSNATYSAPNSTCTGGLTGSSDKASVKLSSVEQTAKTGGLACITAWTATVDLLVPEAGLVADEYAATLTHSFY